jgi:hypothetical protein
MSHEVLIEKLRLFCNPHTLNCITSEELKPEKATIGQERVAHSWQFGLGIKAAGFNLYVAGLPGTDGAI